MLERGRCVGIPVPVKSAASHFYKYSSLDHPEWLRSIILEHRLYIPTLPQLNDPVDGRPRLETLSEEKLAAFLFDAFVKNNPGTLNEVYEREKKVIQYNVRHHGVGVLMREMSSILNRELDGYRVYSMSKRYDNLSLWDRYAAHHTGYCLEFSNEGPLFEHTKDVIYGESAQMDVTNREHRSGYWFFCKRQEWSNEEEVRLVAIRRQGLIVPIDPKWLTRIVFGKDMSAEHRSLILGWVSERRPEPQVMAAKYDSFHQELVVEPAS